MGLEELLLEEYFLSLECAFEYASENLPYSAAQEFQYAMYLLDLLESTSAELEELISGCRVEAWQKWFYDNKTSESQYAMQEIPALPSMRFFKYTLLFWAGLIIGELFHSQLILLISFLALIGSAVFENNDCVQRLSNPLISTRNPALLIHAGIGVSSSLFVLFSHGSPLLLAACLAYTALACYKAFSTKHSHEPLIDFSSRISFQA